MTDPCGDFTPVIDAMGDYDANHPSELDHRDEESKAISRRWISQVAMISVKFEFRQEVVGMIDALFPLRTIESRVKSFSELMGADYKTLLLLYNAKPGLAGMPYDDYRVFYWRFRRLQAILPIMGKFMDRNLFVEFLTSKMSLALFGFSGDSGPVEMLRRGETSFNILLGLLRKVDELNRS